MFILMQNLRTRQVIISAVDGAVDPLEVRRSDIAASLVVQEVMKRGEGP